MDEGCKEQPRSQRTGRASAISPPRYLLSRLPGRADHDLANCPSPMHDRALVTHPTTQRKSGYSCSSRGSTQASAERGAPAAENDAPFEGGLTVATAEARAAGTRGIVAAKVNLDNPLRDSTEVGHDVAVTEVLPVTRSNQVPRRRRTPESSAGSTSSSGRSKATPPWRSASSARHRHLPQEVRCADCGELLGWERTHLAGAG
jgi:hypothetical protein